MSSLIKNCDFLSEGAFLFVNGERNKLTVFGGIVFILDILAIVALSGYFVALLFQRNTSNITYNLKPVTVNTSSLSLDFTGRPFMITLTDTLFEVLNDTGLYSIVGQTTDFYVNGENMMTGNRTFYPMEKCDINKHFGAYQDYFKEEKEINKFFCLKDINTTIKVLGIYGSVSRSFAFQIQKCVADVSDNTTCLPDVDSQLSNINVKIKFLDNKIDHDSVGSPNQIYLRTDTVPTSSTIYKKISYYMTTVNYLTDTGFVFTDVKQDNFYQFPGTKETSDLRSKGILPGNFINVFFIMDNKIDVYNKSYMKFQDLLANIGGIIKFFNQFSIYLVMIVNYKSYYTEVCKLYQETDLSNKLDLSMNTPVRTVIDLTEIQRFKLPRPLTLKSNERTNFSYCDRFNIRCRRDKTKAELFSKLEESVRKELSVNNIYERMVKFDVINKLILNDSQIKMLKESGINQRWFCDEFKDEKSAIKDATNKVEVIEIRNKAKSFIELVDFIK